MSYLFLAPELPLPFSPLSPQAFEEIQRHAGEAWKREAQRQANCATTYSASYGKKELPEPASWRAKPSSPTRINRPHPPEVFMVNKLHYIPGCYDSDKQTAAADKGKCYEYPGYREDSKYVRQRIVYQNMHCGPSKAHQAAQNWIKDASENGGRTIEKMKNVAAESQKMQTVPHKTHTHTCSVTYQESNKPEFVVSMNHWLKKAGREETAEVEKARQSFLTHN
ncbi:uncharacterized protein C4orf51 homolog [Pelodiscus sinensis]|uniref:uncharacterized protein C4orf51 homolog n=1 Tax=Pelodiscus sinensis TaxID=13735 RepID=UPI0003C4BAA4|nr:uncharacterized protein C4orf51 homolog [Pelodiscus sinensis]|eukprot:XP_006114748.1 uncharacterized protein C4orf51 homolog [Pelodiscus sinensis]